MKFSVYQESRAGSRALNQDRMGYSFTRDALLLVVADGMGGHLRGEVAAELALQCIGRLFQQHATPQLLDPKEFLENALHTAHQALQNYQRAKNLPDCPRTTIIACVVQNGQARWAHAGDSRLYFFRERTCLTRTRDHSKIEELLRQGKIRPEELGRHPERNKVIACLGSILPLKVQLSEPITLQQDDVLLLCTDGVWGNVSDPEILELMSTDEVGASVPRLIRQAVEAGGAMCDNATALAIAWHDSDPIAMPV